MIAYMLLFRLVNRMKGRFISGCCGKNATAPLRFHHFTINSELYGGNYRSYFKNRAPSRGQFQIPATKPCTEIALNQLVRLDGFTLVVNALKFKEFRIGIFYRNNIYLDAATFLYFLNLSVFLSI